MVIRFFTPFTPSLHAFFDEALCMKASQRVVGVSIEVIIAI